MKNLIKSALCLAGLGLAMSSVQSYAATTLRVAHFWPATSKVNTDLFEPWAKSIEEASNGDIKVQLYPAGTLAKANSIYDATVNGIVDIGITAQGYTAGRFPLSQIVELPGISRAAPQGSCVLQSLYEKGALGDEYSDTHPLFFFTTGPGNIHFMKKDVKTPADMAGLRISRPTAVVGDILENMNASPVGLPAPDIYAAMQRGVIDGVSFTWEAMKVFRLNELAKYHVQVPFYTLSFVATMNPRAYAKLSDEQKVVLDAHSTMEWALRAGTVFHDLDRSAKEDAVQAGHTIEVVEDPLNDPLWQTPLKSGIDHYLSQLEEKGSKDVREIYQAALNLSASCGSNQGS